MNMGIEVTMTELLQAAGEFRAERKTFEAIMPDSGPAIVAGGSGEFSGAIQSAWALGDLHTPGGDHRAAQGQTGDCLLQLPANLKLDGASRSGPTRAGAITICSTARAIRRLLLMA
jgi:hypothetical protein